MPRAQKPQTVLPYSFHSRLSHLYIILYCCILPWVLRFGSVRLAFPAASFEDVPVGAVRFDAASPTHLPPSHLPPYTPTLHPPPTFTPSRLPPPSHPPSHLPTPPHLPPSLLPPPTLHPHLTLSLPPPTSHLPPPTVVYSTGILWYSIVYSSASIL